MLVARAEVRLRAAAVPGRPAVRRRPTPTRSTASSRASSRSKRGAEPGPEGSAGGDQREQVVSPDGAWRASQQRRQHGAGPLAGPALARRLPRAGDLGRLPLHPAVAVRLPRPHARADALQPLLLLHELRPRSRSPASSRRRRSASRTTSQLLDDPKVAASLKNTFIYTVMMVPGKIIVALAARDAPDARHREARRRLPHDLLPAAHHAAGRDRRDAALPLQRHASGSSTAASA